MRRIYKDANHRRQFNDWASRKGFREWEDFSGVEEYKDAYWQLKMHIAVNEQDCLSAYTELPLSDSTHIDHFRKRSLYSQLTFEYYNMLVDDRNDNYGACHKDHHKTKVKKETFDGKSRIFNPVEEDMVDFITFNANGEMLVSTEDNTIAERVTETIRVFNLNHPLLMARRSELIMNVQYCRQGAMDDNEIRACLKNSGFPTLLNWTLANL